MIANKDPGKGHFLVSMIKSVVRMVAAGSLMMAAVDPNQLTEWLLMAGAGLILAEVLGVIEEIV